MKKEMEMLRQKMTDRRLKEVRVLVDPIFNALYDSPLTFSSGVALRTAEFIADPSSVNMARLISATSYYYEECIRHCWKQEKK